MMIDHQDSEHFMGVRSEDELLDMLDRAERKMNHHYTLLQKGRHRKQLGLEMRDETKDRIYHMRNYKALEGVVKTLRWTLGDKSVEHPLE